MSEKKMSIELHRICKQIWSYKMTWEEDVTWNLHRICKQWACEKIWEDVNKLHKMCKRRRNCTKCATNADYARWSKDIVKEIAKNVHPMMIMRDMIWEGFLIWKTVLVDSKVRELFVLFFNTYSKTKQISSASSVHLHRPAAIADLS